MKDAKSPDPGSEDHLRELPLTVPERRRTDATVVVPESYQPGTDGTHRERIVPTGASVASILTEVRRPGAERLDVESKAAQGGMGLIEVAVDRALDRRIALKTLHAHLRDDESAVRMFLREARLTGLLEHPHIVPIYDIGERGGTDLYFAMKLVEGRTLADVVRALPPSRTPLDTATLYGLLDVVAKVCDALAFAHSRGVLHCDVKPANVMIGDFGEVYLMDWGIARLVSTDAPGSVPSPDGRPRSPSATDNSVIGTPCYMSPEQARGDRGRLDERSDVFLVGAMLYEILTRRPPYHATDRGETISLAMAGVFPSPRRIAGDAAVPPELDRIALRAMAKDPRSRYPTVRALRDDVVQFMRGGAEFPRRSFAAGDVVIREGESGDSAFIIVDGTCEVRKDTPSGEHVVKTVGPGDVFGEMALLSEGPRTATVVATTNTTTLVVTSGVLEQEMAALKPWIATLLKSLAARFRDVDTKSRATFAASPSPARLANQVLMHAVTWGTAQGSSRVIRWSLLSAEIEAQLGLPPLSVFGAITRYGMELDVDGDLLTIPDVDELTSRLREDLSLA